MVYIQRALLKPNWTCQLGDNGYSFGHTPSLLFIFQAYFRFDGLRWGIFESIAFASSYFIKSIVPSYQIRTILSISSLYCETCWSQSQYRFFTSLSLILSIGIDLSHAQVLVSISIFQTPESKYVSQLKFNCSYGKSVTISLSNMRLFGISLSISIEIFDLKVSVSISK